MKKTLSIVLLLVLVLSIATTVKAATPGEELLTFLSGKFTIAGETYKATAKQIEDMETYFENNTITAAQRDSVKAKVNELVKYVNDTKVTDYAKLTTAQRNHIIALVDDAAAVLNLTVVYTAVDDTFVLKSGSTVLGVFDADKTLVQTGGNNVVIISTVVAIIAIAAYVAVRKFNN